MANNGTAIEESAINGLMLEGALSPLRWWRGEIKRSYKIDALNTYSPEEFAALEEATIKWRVAPLCEHDCGCEGDSMYVIEEANARVPRIAALIIEDEEGFANLSDKAPVKTVFRCGPAVWDTWVEEEERIGEDLNSFVELYYGIGGFVEYGDEWITELAAKAALGLIREVPDVISSNFQLTKDRGDILHKIAVSKMERSLKMA